jgi:hypothetical protein
MKYIDEVKHLINVILEDANIENIATTKNPWSERIEKCTRKFHRDINASMNNFSEVFSGLLSTRGFKPLRKDAKSWVEKEDDGVYRIFSVAPFSSLGDGYSYETVIKFYTTRTGLYIKPIVLRDFHPSKDSEKDYMLIRRGFTKGFNVNKYPTLRKLKDLIEKYDS